MIVIGERINSTRKSINEAIRSRDRAFIAKEAARQRDAGADYIDVNCAMTSGDEAEDIDWVIGVVQSEMSDVSICIDSPNHLAVARALRAYKATGKVLINSITADDGRISAVIPLAMEYGAQVVALTMTASGMPHTAEERAEIAATILEKVCSRGFQASDLLFDPLIRPVSTEPDQGAAFLRSLPLIKKLGQVRTVCGLSNISYGLPRRAVINAAFLSMACQQGLDAAILDPTEPIVFSSLKAADALLGADDYCGNYIAAFRAGRLV